MSKLIKILILISCLQFLLYGCDSNNTNSNIEKNIRDELNKSPAIANLSTMYVLKFIHSEKNMIFPDDLYLVEAQEIIDYGFNLKDSDIKVVDEDGVKKLKVRLGEIRELPHHTNMSAPETTNAGYVPRDQSTGKPIKISEHLKGRIEELKKIYNEEHMRYAKENAENFFRVLAKKYDLELELNKESK